MDSSKQVGILTCASPLSIRRLCHIMDKAGFKDGMNLDSGMLSATSLVVNFELKVYVWSHTHSNPNHTYFMQDMTALNMLQPDVLVELLKSDAIELEV